MTEATYEGRNQEHLVVHQAMGEGQGITFRLPDGQLSWGYGGDPSLEGLAVGDHVLMETRGGRVTGAMRFGGQDWLYRLSDQELKAEDDAWRADWERDKRESLAANREAWQARQDALPDWLKDRLNYFHAHGGQKFALDGWHYEIGVCELAALFAEDGGEEGSEQAQTYAVLHGVSGNQWGMALALARAHLAAPGKSMAGTVAALAPLTGSADYS